jgi:hypothetical protein
MPKRSFLQAAIPEMRAQAANKYQREVARPLALEARMD